MRQLKITKQITNREQKSLDKYLSEISSLHMITVDDEVDLALRIKAGDHEALERLVNANLRFVVSVAKQYQGQGMPLCDLINEGNAGLIKAAQRFDETRGFKFISYAVWWIRQSILQALADQGRMIRLPLNRIGMLSKINKAAAVLEQKFEREPSIEEIAKLMRMDREEVESYIDVTNKPISLDAPLNTQEENTLGSLLENEDEPCPDYSLIRESLQREIKELLTVLCERERVILCSYFGLCGQKEMSLEEICFKLQLSRERVRQIKDGALKKLRNCSHTLRLKFYLG